MAVPVDSRDGHRWEALAAEDQEWADQEWVGPAWDLAWVVLASAVADRRVVVLVLDPALVVVLKPDAPKGGPAAVQIASQVANRKGDPKVAPVAVIVVVPKVDLAAVIADLTVVPMVAARVAETVDRIADLRATVVAKKTKRFRFG